MATIKRTILMVALGAAAVTAQAQPYSLNNNEFETFLTVDVPGRNPVFAARSRQYQSEQAIVYWAFDRGNPEALFKLLDGRGYNGHWWLDLAVTSDLHTQTELWHWKARRGRGEPRRYWIIRTGKARDILNRPPKNMNPNALIHCAYPKDITDRECKILGYGTSLSMRDAFDQDGFIPEKYFR